MFVEIMIEEAVPYIVQCTTLLTSYFIPHAVHGTPQEADCGTFRSTLNTAVKQDQAKKPHQLDNPIMSVEIMLKGRQPLVGLGVEPH